MDERDQRSASRAVAVRQVNLITIATRHLAQQGDGLLCAAVTLPLTGGVKRGVGGELTFRAWDIASSWQGHVTCDRSGSTALAFDDTLRYGSVLLACPVGNVLMLSAAQYALLVPEGEHDAAQLLDTPDRWLRVMRVSLVIDDR